MRNQLRWAVAALAVGVLAVAGFGAAVVARGGGEERGAPGGEIELSAPRTEVGEVPQVQSILGRAYVGITLAQENGDVAITGVLPDSPAEEAGLREDDAIRAIDGEEVKSVEAVVDRVEGAEPGDELTFTVERDGEEREITVTLGERPILEMTPGPMWMLPGHLGDLDLEELLPKELLDLSRWMEKGRGLDELLERFISAEVRYLDEDGNPASARAVAGTIKATTESGLTVAPNGGGVDQSFRVGDETRVRRDLRRADLEDLEAGDRVVVILIGAGEEATAILAFSPAGE